MPFKRVWDSSCPRVWDSWEDRGCKWVIQDLPPEDDAEAVELIVENLVKDEVLCTVTGTYTDPVSKQGCYKFWSEVVMPQRTTLACYCEKDGKRTMAGLNAVFVKCKDDEKDVFSDYKVEGYGLQQVLAAMAYMESQVDMFQVLGVDKYLSAAGLAVKREFRGGRIGAKLLQAREPLCRYLSIKATATVFSGPVSPKLAAESGFDTMLELTLDQLADAGLDFPRNGSVIKYMGRKYGS